MNRAHAVEIRENELAAINARADALSLRDASDWEEAIDWGVPDYGGLQPIEWRTMPSPELD